MSLYYRHRPNTGTAWPSTWTFFGTDSNDADEWSWAFPWRYNGVDEVQGHYQFHTIATDNAGNIEAEKTAAEAEHHSTFQHANKCFNKLYIPENSYIPG